MKESFEIVVRPCDLHEIREGNRIRYTLNDGDTILTLGTNNSNISEKLTVSKFRNAVVAITIVIDHNDVEYKGIQL